MGWNHRLENGCQHTNHSFLLAKYLPEKSRKYLPDHKEMCGIVWWFFKMFVSCSLSLNIGDRFPRRRKIVPDGVAQLSEKRLWCPGQRLWCQYNNQSNCRNVNNNWKGLKGLDLPLPSSDFFLPLLNCHKMDHDRIVARSDVPCDPGI